MKPDSPFPSIDFALESDLTEVWSIYDYYVRHSVATFAYVTPSPEQLRSEWQRLHPFYPYLVGRWKGAVIGYAYAHPHSPRAAYQWTVELSIYLAPEYRGKGWGRRLYCCLIDLLRAQGVVNAYVCITHPNPISEQFHHRLGFTPLSLWPKAGYKDGRWLDVTWMQLTLNPHPDRPEPPCAVSALPPDFVSGLLTRHNNVTP